MLHLTSQLGCLHENKGALVRMFTSDEWKSSRFAKTNDEKILGCGFRPKFWKNIITCLKGALPHLSASIG